MKNDHIYYEPFWHLNSSIPTTTLTQDIHTEVAIIGGGMAGLSAAQAFANRNKKVVLVEKNVCGSGASGKAGGFITPNAELSLSDFEDHSSLESARKIWAFINNGVENIKDNIFKHNFACDYTNHPGLFVANCDKTFKNLQKEYENLLKLDYPSRFFDAKKLENEIGTKKFFGGITYDNSFGINPYKYGNSLKKHLIEKGVSLFENTLVTNIDDHTIFTNSGKITADIIVVCLDKFLPDLNILTDYIYHAQNYILVSNVLNSDDISKMFPDNPYMVWDSQLIYNYFRLTYDNRLLIGGGDFFSIYNEEKTNHTYGRNKLIKYINKVFPNIPINFEFQWSGLIGISKDVGPIATPDKKYPHIYYIAASAGLPIANALGNYSAEHLLDKRTDLDEYFKPDRKYFIGKNLEKVLGKKLTFAINNYVSQGTVGCF